MAGPTKAPPKVKPLGDGKDNAAASAALSAAEPGAAADAGAGAENTGEADAAGGAASTAEQPAANLDAGDQGDPEAVAGDPEGDPAHEPLTDADKDDLSLEADLDDDEEIVTVAQGRTVKSGDKYHGPGTLLILKRVEAFALRAIGAIVNPGVAEPKKAVGPETTGTVKLS